MVTLGAWTLFIYWAFVQRLGDSQTRFQLRTKTLSLPARMWIAIVIVAGSGFASYLLGYVAARAMYWPHKLLAAEPLQHRMLIKSINPYTSGIFREYVVLEMTRENSSLELIWPKRDLLHVSANQVAAPIAVCVTLRRSAIGTSVIGIVSCP